MMSTIDPTGLSATSVATDRVSSQGNAEKAAEMLEGLFVQQLLKVMRKTVPESSLFGQSLGRDIFTEMLDETIADEVARGEGVGLRQVLLDQLGGGSVPISSASRAAMAFRRVASANDGVDRATGGVDRTTGGHELEGVRYEAPDRPEPVQLRDADGHLRWPVSAPSHMVDGAGTVVAPGGSEVLASASGQVVEADHRGVLVQHAGGLRTWYGGLGQVLAQRGDLVLRGQVLGRMDRNGEIRFLAVADGRPLDPSELSERLSSDAGRMAIGSQAR